MKLSIRCLLAILVSFFACLSVAQAYTLSGTVYGGSTPMVGATVTLTNALSAEKVGQVTADASGKYSFVVATGSFALDVQPIDTIRFKASRINAIQVVSSDVTQDVLMIEGFPSTVSGKITMPTGFETGSVNLTKDSLSLGGTCTGIGGYGVIGADGRYVIGVEDGDYCLNIGIATKSGPAFSMYVSTKKKFTVAGNVVKDIDLSTIAMVTLQGKTTDANGVPVGNVELMLSGTSSSNEWETIGFGANSYPTPKSDAQGNYNITLPGGTYSIQLTPPIGSNGRARTLSLDFLTSKNLDLALGGFPSTVSGKITMPTGFETGSVNLTKDSLSLGGTCTGIGGYGVIGADGRYVIGVEDGDYCLNVGIATKSGPAFSMYVSTKKKFTVAGNVVKDVDLSTITMVTLQGKTTDANGVPVGNVELMLSGTSSSNEWETISFGANSYPTPKSDAQGNYNITLPGGVYSIQLTPPTGSSGRARTLSVDVLTSKTLDLALGGFPSTVSGKVTMPAGFETGSVNLTKDSLSLGGTCTGIGGYGVIGADGRYVIGVEDGDYCLNVGIATKSGPAFSMYVSTKQKFTVAGNVVKDVDLSTIAMVTLQGKTTDANGVPVGNVELMLSGTSSSNEWETISFGANSYPTPKSDAQGNYNITLPGGVYSIQVTPPYGSGFKGASFPATIVAGYRQAIILPFTDSTPPKIISGPTFRSLTSSSVVVEWQTDEPTKGAVKVGSATVLADTLATTHSIQITGLAASTAYSAEVSVTDATGNGPTVKSVNFTTAATADIIPPVILEGPTVTGSSATSLVVEWVTSEPAKGTLSYGVGAALSSTVSETTFSVAHSIELTGLSADSAYSVRVSATDAANNGPTLSSTKSGRTLAAPDTTAPVITNGPLVSDITDNSATITWKTDEPSTGGVSWNDGVAYGVLSDDKLATDHSARITGLNAGKSYHLTVSSKDALGNGPTLSKTVDFATQALADMTAPQLLALPTVISITNQSAVIQWDTDEPADSQIIYGISTLDKSDSRAALTKKHTLPLVGLAPATTYQLQVRSRDTAGNVSLASAIISFTTRANPDTQLPVFDTPPAVGYTTDKKAVIQWTTDKLTDSQVTITPITFDEPPRVNSEGVLKDLHELSMTGLTPNKTYKATVTSTDLWGNTVTQPLGEFTTPPMPDSQAPTITTAPSVQASATTATVTWSTDKLADSKASYGPTGGALSQVTGDIAYSKQHSVVLSKLQPTTAYQVQVGSSDPSGNGPTLSALVSFTTPAVGTAGTVTTTTTSTTTTTVGSTTTTTVVANPGGQAAVDLAQGWNLIGNGHESSFDITAVLGDASKITTVWKWLAAKATWAFYAPGLSAQTLIDYTVSKGYDVLTTIQAGEGFWVNTKLATTVSLPKTTAIASGSFNPAGIRPLVQGWSLIATGDNPTPATFNNSLSMTLPSPGTTPTNLISLWAWDTANAGWYFWAPSLVNAGALQTYIQSKGYLDFTALPSIAPGTILPTTGVWVNRP